jgi:rhodanese-related sulfurtransferase
MAQSDRLKIEPTRRDKLAITFMQMAEAAMAEVNGVVPEEVRHTLAEDPEALIVDVRDAAEVPSTGLAVRGVNISLGNLPVKADLELPEEWRDSRLQDRARQVVTTCQTGENAARGAKLLKDMGFENVSYMVGGMEAWKTAGLPTD